ncbi:alpha/beta hydrolase [Gracilimonas sp.]|uniref:alpha/beta fold hydrolase n=1 Tax=Gracilimonas sp. TaxID=1974203 RepID=UPI0032EFBCFF
MKRILLVFVSVFFVTQALSQKTTSSNMIEGESFEFTTQHSTLHYEKYGSGTPLLILHGNGGSTKSMYRLLPDLVSEYEVIAIDSPCHGQSSCNENLLSYEFIAQEITAFVNELGYDKIKIWGHSDGGIVALMLGYTIPGKIDRMLVSGANTRLDTTALLPGIVEMINRYDEIPMPDMRVQVKLMANQKPIPDSKIKEISIPVTLMVGDRDAVRIEHTLEMFNLLPNANLCVLPGTSHFLENPGYVITQLQQLNTPFRSPSTLDVVQQISGQIFQN